MKSGILIPIITFIAGAVLMMVLLNQCDSDKIKKLESNLKMYQDSTVKLSDSNNILTKQRQQLSYEKIWHDSVSGKTIDSFKVVIKGLKSRYYADTARFIRIIQNLQSAFDNRDSLKAQAAIDSLKAEASSATWSAMNIFYQYDEMDSVWRLQKTYDDSIYHALYMVDSAKDGRFYALLSINNQMGKDYENALKEIQKLKNGKKFWLAIGAVIGAATNLFHK